MEMGSLNEEADRYSGRRIPPVERPFLIYLNRALELTPILSRDIMYTIIDILDLHHRTAFAGSRAGYDGGACAC
jgi:hypothetical protein